MSDPLDFNTLAGRIAYCVRQIQCREDFLPWLAEYDGLRCAMADTDDAVDIYAEIYCKQGELGRFLQGFREGRTILRLHNWTEGLTTLNTRCQPLSRVGEPSGKGWANPCQPWEQ